MLRLSTALMFLAIVVLAISGEAIGQVTEPTPDVILQKFIMALGGHEVLGSTNSMELEAKVNQRVKEKSFDSTETILVSNGRWINTSSQDSQSGFDGKRHWNHSTGCEPQWIDNYRYPFNLRDPVAYPLHLLSFPGTLTFAGRIEIGGKPALRIAITPSEPEPKDRIRMTPLSLVFDEESKLLIQVLFEQKKVEFSDYRIVQGIMVPFKQKTIYSDMFDSSEYTFSVKSVEFDKKIDDKLFVAPLNVGD